MLRQVRLLVLLSCMCKFALTNVLDVGENMSKLSEANNQFCVNMYKELIEDPNKENVVFSPVSVAAAMAMTHLGAKGDTADQIDRVFMFSKIEDGKFHSAFGELHGLLFEKVSDNITLKSSNRVFAAENIKVLEDYKNALTVYGAQVKQVDFGGSAVEVINAWAKESTEGKIPDLLTADSVDGDTRLMIANTVFFKGDWHSQFREKQTEIREFYVSHYKVVDTSFMFQKGQFRFGYIESLTLQIVELPYAGQEYSMVVMLPDNFDLASVEKALNHENLTDWLSTLSYKTVDLTLPKFKIEETLHLHNIFPKMGLVDIFDKSKSDLSGMVSQSTGIHIDQVIHKAVLEVDEKGSVAAAATTVRVVARSLSSNPHFIADRPFLWGIRHVQTGHLIFIGRLKRPSGPVEEKGGLVEAERAAAERAPSSERVVVYVDHPFIFLVRSKSSSAFHLMGAYKRPEGRIRSHDEL